MQAGNSTEAKSASYRPEIDGLRTIALLAVVVFHFWPSVLPGGYLGVDLFFVISGYVITSALLHNNEGNGTQSVFKFWGRRIRRLVPAVLTLFLFLEAISPLTLYTFEINALHRQMLVSIASVANVYFWRTANNYWATDSENLPLLHTWSLSVEEQFYLIYPLLLFYILGYLSTQKKAHALLVCFMCSLILSFYAAIEYPAANFYLIFTRAWQPLMGCVIAFWVIDWRKQNPAQSPVQTPDRRGFNFCSQISPTLISAISILFIVVAMVLPIATRTIGSYLAAFVVCTGGAICLIQSPSNSNIVFDFLRKSLLVQIGKYSYSMYLWHWPILVICRKCVPSPWLETTIALSLFIVLSVSAYHLIEKPVRLFSPKWTAGILLCQFSILGVLCVFNSLTTRGTTFTRGKYTPTVLYPGQIREAWGNLGTYLDGLSLFEKKSQNKANALLLGDSHAEMWTPVLLKTLSSAKQNLAVHTMAGVPVFLPQDSLKLYGKVDGSFVGPMPNDVIKTLIESNHPRLVILAMRWEFLLRDLGKERFCAVLHHFIRQLPTDTAVLLMEQPPKLHFGDGNFGEESDSSATVILNHPWLRGIEEDEEAKFNRRVANDLLEKICRESKKTWCLSVESKLMSPTGINFSNQNVLLYRDDNHLTEEGVLLFEDKISDILTQIIQ
jgi:peptidoglycan/LPS O-acetylase OafA/YrhL